MQLDGVRERKDRKREGEGGREGKGEGERSRCVLQKIKTRGDFGSFQYMNDEENGRDTWCFICSKAQTRMTTNTGSGGAGRAVEAVHLEYPEAVRSAEGRRRGPA